MKRLLGVVLLAAAFLGGYHLGRMPGSPDVIGTAREVFQEAAGVVEEVAPVVEEEVTRAVDDADAFLAE